MYVGLYIGLSNGMWGLEIYVLRTRTVVFRCIEGGPLLFRKHPHVLDIRGSRSRESRVERLWIMILGVVPTLNPEILNPKPKILTLNLKF